MPVNENDRHLLANRYELHEKLGEGGMGTVYRATDWLTGTTVALKRVLTVQPDAAYKSAANEVEMRLTLTREFQTLASLRHPNIITVTDYGFDAEQQPYYAMTFLKDAESIRKVARRLKTPARVRLLMQLLQAVAYLHRRGIVHRDLKPPNVLVADDRVQVLDFGLAISHEHADKQVLGTVYYMAPELFMGATPGPAFDLYAVGVIAYETLTRRRPFTADDEQQLLARIVHDDVDMDPLREIITREQEEVRKAQGELPPEYQNLQTLVPVIKSLLCKSPEKRPDATHILQGMADAIQEPVALESTAIRESFLQSARFVGREAELNSLTGALDWLLQPEKDVLDERAGHVWLIGGESGVGKSRLMDELRVIALVRGAMVLRGQCVADGGASYQVWREPLRRLVLSTGVSALEAGVLQEVIPDIDRLLQQDVQPAPPLDSMNARRRLMDTIIELFWRQKQPIVLLLEDLQWLTDQPESQLLLTELCVLSDMLSLLIVGNFRDDEYPQLADELPGVELITLSRLSVEDVADLTRSMLGESVHQDEVVDFLHRETEGNVFFLVEVVRVLAEQAGKLSDIESLTIPASVFAGGIQRVVYHRLSRVSELNRPLLKLAAVIGRRLDLPLLAAGNYMLRTGSYEEVMLQDWLFACSEAAVLHVQDGYWQFAHDKLREGLLETLSDDERAYFHRLAASVIEMVYPDDEAYAVALADHWHIAGDLEREVHYAHIAGEQCLAVGSEEEARVICKRALNRLSWDSRSRIPLLQIMGTVYEKRSHFNEALPYLFESLQLAQNYEDVSGRAAALAALSQIIRRQGEYERARGYAEESLRLATLADIPLQIVKSQNTLANIYWHQGDHQRAVNYYRQTLKSARQHNIRNGIAVALNNLGLVYIEMGEYALAKDHLKESMAIKHGLGNQRSIGITLMNLGQLAWRTGEPDALAYHEESMEIYRRMHDRWGIGRNLHYMANILEAQGDFSRAWEYRREALAIYRNMQNRPMILEAVLALGFGDIEAGHLKEAAEYLVEALEISREIGATPRLMETLIGFARLYTAGGQLFEAGNLLGLIQDNPALTQELVRHRLQPLYRLLEKQLTAEHLYEALIQGEKLDIDQVIDGLLIRYGNLAAGSA